MARRKRQRAATAGGAQVRAIPGFVWDAERGRYFPATSRAATSQEERHEQRKRQRADAAAAAQARAERELQPLGLLLRQRAAPWAVPGRASSEQLGFACMARSSRPVPYADAYSAVTALCAAGGDGGGGGQQLLAAGHRCGLAALARLDGSGDVQQAATHSMGSEITAICHVERDLFLFASIGDGRDGGTLATDRLAAGERQTWTVPRLSVFAAAVSGPGQPRVACIGTDGSVQAAALVGGEMRWTFRARTGSDIVSAAFVDGPHVAAGGGRDGRIRLFDLRVDGARHDARRGLFSGAGCGHASAVHGLGGEGWLLASASMDGRVRVWDLRMAAGAQGPAALCASDLGDPLAAPAACRLGFGVGRGAVVAAGSDSLVCMWSLRTGHPLQRLALPVAEGSCTALALAAPGPGPPALFVGQSAAVRIYSSSR
ncbi:hypothetical protein H4R18_002000 [Coemansia javaensis]|uniref:Uncharacterized protein n=1 Tax=Coemansia javaensis TaxID=2761396 RepID=A0A9W8HD89_9FUNG|nr:hypothetical protein H4R18_002000 [Coemansia javaensis]